MNRRDHIFTHWIILALHVLVCNSRGGTGEDAPVLNNDAFCYLKSKTPSMSFLTKISYPFSLSQFCKFKLVFMLCVNIRLHLFCTHDINEAHSKKHSIPNKNDKNVNSEKLKVIKSLITIILYHLFVLLPWRNYCEAILIMVPPFYLLYHDFFATHLSNRGIEDPEKSRNVDKSRHFSSNLVIHYFCFLLYPK